MPAWQPADTSKIPNDERTITDQDFFDALDLSRPGLKKVAAAVKAGDLPAARAATVEYFRTRKNPKWHYDLRGAMGDQQAWAAAPIERHGYAAENVDGFLENRIVFSSGLAVDLGPELNWHIPELTEHNALALNFKRMRYLVWLAEVYATGGDERYLRKLNELLARYLEEWPLVWENLAPDAYIVQRGPDQDAMTCAFRAFTWLELLYTPIPYEGRMPVDLAFRMIRSIWFTLWQYRRFDTDSFMPNNHHLWERGQTPWQAAVMLPEFPCLQGGYQRGRQVVDDHVRHDFYEEGGYNEHSQSYAMNATVRLFMLVPQRLAMLNRRAYLTPLGRRRVRKAMEVFLSLAQPDGRLPAIGDGEGLDIEVMRPFLEEKVVDSAPGRAVMRALGRMPGKPAKTDLPDKALCWREAGYVGARDDWSPDANYMLLSTNTRGYMGHDHLDNLSLMLAAGGTMLIDEPAAELYAVANNLEYKGSPMRGRLYSNASHNVVLPFGEPLSPDLYLAHGWRMEVPKTEIVRFEPGRRHLLVHALHRGYIHARTEREVLFLFKTGWLVRDLIYLCPDFPDKPHRQRWQCALETEVSALDDAAVMLEKGNVRMLGLWPEEAGVTLEIGEDELTAGLVEQRRGWRPRRLDVCFVRQRFMGTANLPTVLPTLWLPVEKAPGKARLARLRREVLTPLYGGSPEPKPMKKAVREAMGM